VGDGTPALEQRASALMASLRRLMSARPFTFTSVEVPERPGIYVIYDGGGHPCYVGQSRNLRRRLLVDHHKGNGKSSIFRRKLALIKRFESELAVTFYIREECAFRFLELESERERRELEHFATALLSPVLNCLAADTISHIFSGRTRSDACQADHTLSRR
jgi:excinuclease UvrABC nuclease subunit